MFCVLVNESGLVKIYSSGFIVYNSNTYLGVTNLLKITYRFLECAGVE